MASVRMKWHGDAVEKKVRSEMAKRLRVAGEWLASTIREDISIPTRTAGHSLPGQPPHADTGTLRKSIEYEVNEDELTLRVGSNLEYARMLEEGTHNMEARPYLVPAVENNQRVLKQILLGKKIR